MKGLRTQGDSDFNNFFKLVQEEANKRGKIYFLDTEQNHTLQLKDMYIADLSGWLLPLDKSNEFEKDYFAHKEWESSKWDDFYTWAEWDMENHKEDKIKIDFNQY